MTSLRIVFRPRAIVVKLAALACLPVAAQSFVCPAKFPGATLEFSPTADGWATGIGDDAPLYSADIFDGPPEQRASLQPDASSVHSTTWRFEGSYPRGIWVQCTYAAGALSLTRRLSKVPAACVAHYSKTIKGRPESVSFDCH